MTDAGPIVIGERHMIASVELKAVARQIHLRSSQRLFRPAASFDMEMLIEALQFLCRSADQSWVCPGAFATVDDAARGRARLKSRQCTHGEHRWRGPAGGENMMTGPFDLERFVAAQSDTYDQALAELVAGRKRSHWMWFVFPQMRGLGSSSAATFYGIGSLDEARAFLAHPLLGPRLARCTGAILDAPAGRSLHEILGSPDDLKFRSSMTLFARAAPANEPGAFAAALDRFCDGKADERTLALLEHP